MIADVLLNSLLQKQFADAVTKHTEDKQITVRYRFQSEFETYAEVLEQCRNM